MKNIFVQSHMNDRNITTGNQGPPTTEQQREQRVQNMIVMLRQPALLPSRTEHWHHQNDGNMRASVCGIMIQRAMDGGLPLQWTTEPHWHPEEDDPDGYWDGTHLRVLEAGETPSPAIPPQVWAWHGLTSPNPDDPSVRADEFNQELIRRMSIEGCESLEYLPVGLANSLLTDAAHTTGSPSPLTQFADLFERKPQDPDWEGWQPLGGQ